jgi:hypothetical protein
VSRRVAPALALPLLAALIAAATPGSALAGSADVAATQKYIDANYALVHAGGREIGRSEASIKSLLRGVRKECLGAAPGSPEGQDSEQIGDELQGAMTIAAVRLIPRSIAAFVHAVAPLRWSNAQLTHTVSTYARKLKTLSALTTPHVCTDVRSWTAAGFATLPASTVSFDLAFDSVNVAIGEVPAEQLAPYERPTERSILHSTTQLETQLTDAENRAVKQWEQTLEAVGVVP